MPRADLLTPDLPAPGPLVAALEALPGVRWSICVRDASGAPLLAHRADDELPTASVGKILLLAAAAGMLHGGELAEDEPLARDPRLGVADSGLWQHLAGGPLTPSDLAVLIGAVSDNWATNVLLDRVGRERVPWSTLDPAGGPRVSLNDFVRDVRGPEHPPTLSNGTAGMLCAQLLALAAGRLPAHAGDGRRVLGWLRLNTDLSMVASAFGLDPLAHTAPDLGLLLANKTGTDAGIRADVGLVVPCGPDGVPDDGDALAYAALAHWAPDLPPDDERRTRLGVLAVMRRIGELVDGWVREPSRRPAAG